MFHKNLPKVWVSYYSILMAGNQYMIMTLQIQPVIMIDFADSACDHEAVKGKSERYHVLCSQ